MPGGRPTKYNEDINEQVYKLSLLGLTDKEMADVIGISESTFNKWKHDYPEFSESVTRGKTKADADVAVSFRKKAIGYQYDEVTKESCINPETKKREMTVTKVVVKEVQPDAGAALNWLKNRQPQHWRDKQEVEQSGVTVVKIKGEF